MPVSTITLKPIGIVRAGETGVQLHIDEPYRPALQGLAGFSHANVLWWSHLADEEEKRQQLTVPRLFRHAPDRLGVFATRFPNRPNPLALSVVKVLAVDLEQGLVDVPAIDAEDGTPLLDLKPYMPVVDRVREVSVPAWCRHWPEWVEDFAAFDWSAEVVRAA
jgi:tRNA-Thr(GGU) m(6)t(6)A37 methyltransferase TsaA